MRAPVHHLADAMRLPLLAASLLPALAAGALAWRAGPMDGGAFVLAVLAALLAHAGTNLANDYYDYVAGNYHKKKTGPAAGSHAIRSGRLHAQQVLAMALAGFMLALALFAYLGTVKDARLLPLGLAGILIGFFYTAPPLKLGYRLFGEACVFIGMGPLLFATVFLAAAGTLPDLGGWLLSVFLGALALNILLAAQVPDIEIDRASRKHTVAARWGPGALTAGYGLSALAGALALAGACLAGGVGLLPLAGLASLYFSCKAYQELKAGRPLPALGLAFKALQWGTGLVILSLMMELA